MALCLPRARQGSSWHMVCAHTTFTGRRSPFAQKRLSGSYRPAFPLDRYPTLFGYLAPSSRQNEDINTYITESTTLESLRATAYIHSLAPSFSHKPSCLFAYVQCNSTIRTVAPLIETVSLHATYLEIRGLGLEPNHEPPSSTAGNIAEAGTSYGASTGRKRTSLDFPKSFAVSFEHRPCLTRLVARSHSAVIIVPDRSYITAQNHSIWPHYELHATLSVVTSCDSLQSITSYV